MISIHTRTYIPQSIFVFYILKNATQMHDLMGDDQKGYNSTFFGQKWYKADAISRSEFFR